MRPIRRQDRALPQDQAYAILDAAAYGTLALTGPDGPYAVTLNHVRVGSKLYFHAAEQGYKLELIAADPRACYTAVSQAVIDPPALTCRYTSAVVFGPVAVVIDPAERRAAINALVDRFAPGHPQRNDPLPDTMAVLCLQITRMTAKSSAEAD